MVFGLEVHAYDATRSWDPEYTRRIGDSDMSRLQPRADGARSLKELYHPSPRENQEPKSLGQNFKFYQRQRLRTRRQITGPEPREAQVQMEIQSRASQTYSPNLDPGSKNPLPNICFPTPSPREHPEATF